MRHLTKSRKRTYLITIDEEWDPAHDELCMRSRGYSLMPPQTGLLTRGLKAAHYDYHISVQALEYAKHDVKRSGRCRIAEGIVNELEKHPECQEQFALVGAQTFRDMEAHEKAEYARHKWAKQWGLE